MDFEISLEQYVLVAEELLKEYSTAPDRFTIDANSFTYRHPIVNKRVWVSPTGAGMYMSFDGKSTLIDPPFLIGRKKYLLASAQLISIMKGTKMSESDEIISNCLPTVIDSKIDDVLLGKK